jgi:hypothetical protein
MSGDRIGSGNKFDTKVLYSKRTDKEIPHVRK